MKRLDPLDAGSGSAAPMPVTPDPGAQDDNGEVAGYFVGECGHPRLLAGPVFWVGPCEECDANAT